MVVQVSSVCHSNVFGKRHVLAVVGSLLACLVTTGLLSGCGNNSGLAPVTGIVSFHGEPVAAAQVLFTSPTHRPAAGETDAEGRYVLSTYETGDGAAVGSYTVTVTARPAIHGGTAEIIGPTTGRPQIQHAAKSPIPLKYSDAANPMLTVEVKPGENEIPLDLK